MTTIDTETNQDTEVQADPVKLVNRGLYNRPLPEDEVNEDDSTTSPKTTQEAETAADPSATTETVDTQFSNWQKRYGDLRRHSAKKEEALSKKVKDLEEQLSKRAGVEPPPIDPKEFEAWKAKFPVLAAAIDKAVEDKVQKVVKTVEPRIEEIESATAEIEIERAVTELTKRHNDWPEISQSKEFQEWVDSRPVAIQNAFYNSFNVDEVDEYLKFYKLEKGVKSQPKSQSNKRPIVTDAQTASSSTGKARGADVNSTGKKVWRADEVAKLSGREYEALEAEIDQAIKEGRYIG